MKSLNIIFGLLLLGVLQSCDPNRIFEENKTIPESSWEYTYKPTFDVQLSDTSIYYTIYVNLRVGSDYKYNNIFLVVHSTNPKQMTEKRRIEIRLANESGKWLGAGLGDLHDYQFPVYRKIKITEPGFYRFEVEQNMREDVLQHIIATGIRVEKTEP